MVEFLVFWLLLFLICPIIFPEICKGCDVNVSMKPELFMASFVVKRSFIDGG